MDWDEDDDVRLEDRILKEEHKMTTHRTALGEIVVRGSPSDELNLISASDHGIDDECLSRRIFRSSNSRDQNNLVVLPCTSI